MNIIVLQSAVNEVTFEVLYNALMVIKVQLSLYVVLVVAKILKFPVTS